jgi:hypothetical protein
LDGRDGIPLKEKYARQQKIKAEKVEKDKGYLIIWKLLLVTIFYNP